MCRWDIATFFQKALFTLYKQKKTIMEGNHFFSEAIRNFLTIGYRIICKAEKSICLGKGAQRALFDRQSGELLCEWEANFPVC